MGRAKKPTVNDDNSDLFRKYIMAKSDKYDVVQLTKLLDKAGREYLTAICSHEIETGILRHELHTHDDHYKASMVAIDVKAFHSLNQLVDTIEGLKSAFKNAIYQKQHKLKAIESKSSRKVIELSDDEHFYLRLLRDRCKENNVDLADTLKKVYFEMKNTEIYLTLHQLRKDRK